MKVIFSGLTAFKLEKLSAYLKTEWGERAHQKFIERLDSKLQTIQRNPELFRPSQYDKKIRKCVVTSQTSILYEIHEDFIFVVNLIDNRQDPKQIFEELKKYL